MPQHTAAIRSARLWFDAAVTLVKRQNSAFRMDDEIQKIMNEYEDLARRDASSGSVTAGTRPMVASRVPLNR
jgi:hypothetical protein